MYNNNNNQIEIPEIEAEDVEVRVSQVFQWGVQCLLYKTSRYDMRALDAMFGPMNWQINHEVIGDNKVSCTISVWDDEKKQWISKNDVGEGDDIKSAYSDSTKRSGFLWNLGRSLYSAPTIFINLPTENKNGKWKLDNKQVKDIYVSKYVVIDGKISKLEICINDGQRVFTYDDKRCLPIKNTTATSKNNVPVKEEKPVITQSVEKKPSEPAQKPVEDVSVDYLDMPMELLVKEEEPAEAIHKADTKPVVEEKKNEDVNMDEARIISAEFSTTKNLMKYFKIEYQYRYKPETVTQFQPICNAIGVETIKNLLKETKLFEAADIDCISMDNLSNLKGASYELNRAKDVRFAVKVSKNSKGYDVFDVKRI